MIIAGGAGPLEDASLWAKALCATKLAKIAATGRPKSSAQFAGLVRKWLDRSFIMVEEILGWRDG
jgi:hypothetical protein